MRIELDYDEIKSALAKVLEDKTNDMFGGIDPDNCSFDVKDEKGEIVYISGLTFSVDL